MKKLMLLIVSAILFAAGQTQAEITLKKGDKVVFWGDSITNGSRNRKEHEDKTGYFSKVESSIKAAHPDWDVKVYNAGHSGYDVRGLQKLFEQDIGSRKPNIVFIFIGVNDVWKWNMARFQNKGSTKEEYETGLKDIIGRTKAIGAQVVLATPATLGEKTDGSNPQDKMLDEYCDISRRVATEEKIPLVDLRKTFMAYLKQHNPENKSKGILTADGVHPIDEGAKLIATEMLKLLGIPLAELSAAPSKK